MDKIALNKYVMWHLISVIFEIWKQFWIFFIHLHQFDLHQWRSPPLMEVCLLHQWRFEFFFIHLHQFDLHQWRSEKKGFIFILENWNFEERLKNWKMEVSRIITRWNCVKMRSACKDVDISTCKDVHCVKKFLLTTCHKKSFYALIYVS